MPAATLTAFRKVVHAALPRVEQSKFTFENMSEIALERARTLATDNTSTSSTTRNGIPQSIIKNQFNAAIAMNCKGNDDNNDDDDVDNSERAHKRAHRASNASASMPVAHGNNDIIVQKQCSCYCCSQSRQCQ